jgi:2-keto-4-pentenoate hydratase
LISGNDPMQVSDMTNVQACSLYLVDLWRKQQRCTVLPERLVPSSKAEAYAIQALIEKESAAPIIAWKIAATSVAGQKHIGVDGPLAGRYISERMLCTGMTVPFGRNHMKVAEVEFAFRMGRDLVPRATPYLEADVFDAIESLHPAIEIPDSRYDQFERVGANALIADNACADWLCLGESAPDLWRDLDLAAFVPTARVRGKTETQGLGRNVLGSPRVAMTWLANELSSLGITLAKGQTVTTGTCVVPMAIASGDIVEADFGALGSVDVTIGA